MPAGDPAGIFVSVLNCAVAGESIEVWLHFVEALFDGEAGFVVEVTDGCLDAVGVGSCELLCEEASHWRIGFECQEFPEAFADGPGSVGAFGADLLANGGKFGSFEEEIDPVPEVDRFRFIDEVGVSGWFGGSSEGDFCVEVCGCGIFDVGDGDEVLTVADLSKFAVLGGVEEFGDEVVISGAPNEVWSEGAGEEALFAGSFEDSFFGEGFGVWVVAEPAVGIGE